MAKIEKTVFISYRRKDISWALAVYQYLMSRNYDVFFDYESIYSGDFEQVIVSNIKARAHFVLILTPTALDRCNEPGDWLRREIETAVDEKRNIIPVFLDGFSFDLPSVKERLTGKIGAIKHYNGLDIPSGYFMEAMVRLSERYLNTPLDAVIHPISTEVQKVVKDIQQAANNALVEKSDDIKELVKPADGGPVKSKQLNTATSFSSERRSDHGAQRNNLRMYGIGAGILLALAIGFYGIRTWLNTIDSAGAPTEITRLATNPSRLEPSPALSVELEATEPTTPSLINSLVASPTSPTEIGAAELTTPALVETPTFPIAVTGPTAVDTRISQIDGATLVYIPPSTFTMGLTPEQISFLLGLCKNNDCEDLLQASQPAHQVELTSGYWIYRTEVSNAQYSLCVAAGGCIAPRSFFSYGHGQDSYYDNPVFKDYPIVWVDWNRAQAYCSWAGGMLPTSAQWEYAARGDDGRLFPWGNDPPDQSRANVDNLFGGTTSITGFSDFASPFGLLNATGNVWEWVSDWYSTTYYSENTDWVDPKGPPDGVSKVGRGGSRWIQRALSSVAIQDWETPDSESSDYNYDGVGFRCVISAPN